VTRGDEARQALGERSKPTEGLRRAAGVALTAACAIGAVALLASGLDLGLRMCAMGGCSQPKDEGLGELLLFGGALLALIGLFVPPRITRSSQPTLRGAVALPAALVVGLVLAWSGVADISRPAENVTLFLMVIVVIVVLVPPKGISWLVGIVIGAGVAAAFGDVPLPGLAVALSAVALWTAIEPSVQAVMSHPRPVIGMAPPGHHSPDPVSCDARRLEQGSADADP